MYNNPCSQGLSALRNTGLHAEPDKDLQISFYDPIELSADLCKLQNRYAYQGICEFQSTYRGGNPTIPTLYVDGKSMGTLKNLKVQELKALAEPSPFGRGNKTVYDDNVRKALEIKGNRINLDFTCPYEIQKMAPVGRSLTAKLYKLAIYEKDGFFAEHADTLHGDNHIGTLVVCLPVPHEGGTFILSDDGNELKLPFNELIKGGKIPWVAFYTDVKHQVEMVKSGMRMTLQFDLIVSEKDPDECNDLSSILQGKKYLQAPVSYRFQDFNLEILDSIRNKLGIVLPQEERKADPSPMKKRDRPDNDKPLKAKATKQKKGTALAPSKIVDLDEDTKLKKEECTNPDCVALLLKRRYGATTLSLDTLRGSDSALYHALKDHFRVEVKKIILEQYSDYEGGYRDQPIEIVALSEIKDLAESCSSEDEFELGPDNKHIPKKHETIASKTGGKKMNARYAQPEEEMNENLKKVCLVSGFSPKSLSTLVNQSYAEHTGNEAQAGVYAYIHAALFVYPR